jgi:hypothetical protein
MRTLIETEVKEYDLKIKRIAPTLKRNTIPHPMVLYFQNEAS